MPRTTPKARARSRAYLARWHPERPALVIGVMRDKDADAILRELLPVTSSVIATAADTPRAMPADGARGARQTARCVAIRSSPATIPTRRSTRALATSPTVCVAGSIFLVGAVRERLCMPRVARTGGPDILR